MALIYRHWFPCTVTPENPHGKGYTGYTYQTVEERDKERFTHKKDSVGLKRAIVEYGKENMQTDIIEQILPIHELVIEREIYWIAYFDDYHNGCNWTKGGDGMLGWKPTPETRAKLSEAARKAARKRVEDGTHHFLGSEMNLKRVKDGTHHFLGGDIQRKSQRKRVEDGTHHLLGGDIQRKLVKDGTHNFLGDSNPSHKRVEDGTHPFLGGDIQRKVNRKRVEDGTHNFSRKNNPKARPEYMQARWEFILLYPLGIEEARKHLREKFSDIPHITLWRWTREWQTELESD